MEVVLTEEREATMKSAEDIKADLMIAIKHIRFAIEEAAKNGQPRLGILSVHDDGGGTIECKMDCEFIEDVARLIDAPALSEDDREECRDLKFLDRFGLRTHS